MKITLVRIKKAHAWSKGMKGYLFLVAPHKGDKKFWQVLKTESTSGELAGIKPKKSLTEYLLQKIHVEVIKSFKL